MTATDRLDVGYGRNAALALHRAGQLDEAYAAYDRLLATDPEDPDLVGLLGVLALQRHQTTHAETLLRRALSLVSPDPRVHLRNANNLIALLDQQGHSDAARQIAGGDLPDWPPDTPPDAAARDTLLSLAEALAKYGQPARALSLLDSAMAHFSDDTQALNLTGRMHLKRDDPQNALPALQLACERDPANWQALAALSVAHEGLNQPAPAREAARRCARAAPVFVAPRQAGQQASILVLNDALSRIHNLDGGLAGLHFSANYISQASAHLAAEFHFASIFANLPPPLPDLPRADLVFNNLASGEQMNIPGRLDQAVALVDRIGLPVLNHPNAVSRMTRQKIAILLQGIPGLRIPRIARYNRDLEHLDQIASDIAANFAYPVIVRHVAADESSNSLISEKKTAVLVNDANELCAFVRGVNWPQFYVIEYVNLRKPDGNFRRIRAGFFPDEIVITACGYYSEWMVAGWRTNKQGHAFYDAFPQRVVDMQRTLRNPEAMLGSDFMAVLRAIRERVPLEVFGMDFDLDADGQVVLFEAQSTSIFLMPRGNVPDHLQLPPELDDRVNAAFIRLVNRTIAAKGRPAQTT